MSVTKVCGVGVAKECLCAVLVLPERVCADIVYIQPTHCLHCKISQQVPFPHAIGCIRALELDTWGFVVKGGGGYEP